jgi:hypothetical protein
VQWTGKQKFPLIFVYTNFLLVITYKKFLRMPARPRTQHDYHHDMKVKPEAATAVVELLMMGGKRPKHVEL